jgi:hypothetical protein
MKRWVVWLKVFAAPKLGWATRNDQSARSSSSGHPALEKPKQPSAGAGIFRPQRRLNPS